MRCSEIINILEELAPHRMACEWDNPGLLAGRKEKEVKKLLDHKYTGGAGAPSYGL